MRLSCTGQEAWPCIKERAREEAEQITKEAEAIYGLFFFFLYELVFVDSIVGNYQNLY